MEMHKAPAGSPAPNVLVALWLSTGCSCPAAIWFSQSTPLPSPLPQLSLHPSSLVSPFLLSFSCSSLSQIPFLTRWHPAQEQSSANRCQWPAHLSACQPWLRCGVSAQSLPAMPELGGAHGERCLEATKWLCQDDGRSNWRMGQDGGLGWGC